MLLGFPVFQNTDSQGTSAHTLKTNTADPVRRDYRLHMNTNLRRPFPLYTRLRADPLPSDEVCSNTGLQMETYGDTDTAGETPHKSLGLSPQSEHV